MLRNKLYVYGEETQVPCHMHYGKEVLDRIIGYGDHPALIDADSGEIMTYKQLAQQTVDVALSLARIGVKKGDVVSICSDKRMEVIPTILGIFCVGATYSPSDITYGKVQLRPFRLEIANPKVMFCSTIAYDHHKASYDTVGCIEKYIIYGDEKREGEILYKEFLTETADVSDFVPTPVDGWKDKLYILFSSGTTGMPKGVPWTHLGFLNNSSSYSGEKFKFKPILVTREWYYTYGTQYTLSSIRYGATLVFSPRNQEEDLLKAIEKYKTEVLLVAPAYINELIKSTVLDKYDMSSVTTIISASTPVMAEQVVAVKKRLRNLKDVVQIYGTTESGNSCNEIHAPKGPKDGSVGPPSYGFVFKVVDLETREPLGPNQRGEICMKSVSVTSGYIGVENRDHLDSEGFYISGDMGYYDEDGYFYVVNRLKEMIKFNDSGIAPAELESILLQHPAVRDAGVAGAPDPACGERPTGLVVLQPGAHATEKEIEEFVNDRITYRMRLAGGVKFVDKLPRGAGDKLDRKALKLML